MRISALAVTGLAAASPTLVARKQGRPDISGSYWDVTISRQSGRPGYSIRDLSASFHNPKFEQTVNAACHYSFVPQGTSPPSVTDRCDSGLQYTWDSTLNLHQKVVVGNETLTVYGNANIETTRKGDGTGGSTTTGSGRVEIHHYCNEIGCSAPNGCVTIECEQGLTD